MLDERQEIRDEKQEMRDERQEMRYERQEIRGKTLGTRNGRKKMEDRRWEMGDELHGVGYGFVWWSEVVEVGG